MMMAKQQQERTPKRPRPSRRGRRQARRLSTITWIKHFRQAEDSHRKIVDKLDAFVPPQEGACDADPVNILVLGGGGLRGYAHVGMLGGLLELNDGIDFLQYFDLTGGTSVGGVISLCLNHVGTFTTEGMQKGEGLFDDIFHQCFAKRSWKRLLSHASFTNEDTALAPIFRKQFPELPIYNPNSLNAFALSAAKSKKGAAGAAENPEPFVFRTYDLPREESRQGEQTCFQVCAGSNEVKLWEAMGATSACPGLVDRIELDINGEPMRFADGGVIANHPVAVAITEAFRLWPHRRIGKVVLLGLDGECPPSVLHAVDVVKQTNPDMEFVALTPPVEVHPLLESQQVRLKEALNKAKKFVLESKEASALLNRLRSSRQHG